MNRLNRFSILASFFGLLCLSIAVLPVSAQHLPPVGIDAPVGPVVDLADIPLNRPTPDKLDYTKWVPQKDEFFPSLLGLRTPGVKMIRTKHFAIYYSGAEGTARRVADFADEVLDDMLRYYPTFVDRYVPITVVVDDQADFLGNAFAIYQNNYIHFWTNPIDWEIRGTSDWVRDTFTHELAHIVTLKAAHKDWPFSMGITNTSQSNRNPDYSFTFVLSHLAMPRGFAEGIAQYESRKYGAGPWDTHRDMLLRMATLENDLLSWTELGTTNGKDQLHAEQVYNQGFSILNYVDEIYGEDKVRGMFEAQPIVNFKSAVKQSLGISANQLYRDWLAHIQESYGAVADSVNAVGEREGELIYDGGALDYHPVYSPDGTRVAFITNGDNDYFITKLMVMNLATRKVKKIDDGVDNRFTWTSDGNKLVYIKAVGARWDIFTHDLNEKKGNSRRVTIGLRGKDPSLSPDGKQVAFVTMRDGTSNLGIVNIDGTDIRMLTHNNNATQYYGPKWSPDGKQILFSIFRGEDRDIAVVNADTTPWPKKLEKKKREEKADADSTVAFPDSLAYANNAGFKPLIHSSADERDPVWLPDGSGFVFSSNRTGIFNLYSYDLTTGRLKQITNVIGGAFAPSVSPDGQEVLYTGYHTDNYNIYRIQRSEAVAAAAPEALSRDYSSIYTGEELSDLYPIGRYSTRLASYGITPYMLLGPTFIGNRFGLDQLSVGAQAAWGDLLGSDLFVMGGTVGKNLRREMDLNSGVSFFYQNVLTPISSEQRTFVPSIYFGGSRETINSLLDLGTIIAVRDTNEGTLVTTTPDGEQRLIPRSTQYGNRSVTEQNEFKDVFTDFVVGTDMRLGGNQSISFSYGHRTYSENLRMEQVLLDSTRIIQTDPATGAETDITEEILGVREPTIIRDDFLYRDLRFFKSNNFSAGWRYQRFKPTMDMFVNPTGGRALSFSYRRINATVTDSLALSTDLNQDFIPDPTEAEVSPTVFREDNVKLGINEFIASWNEFISLPGRSTLALQAFGGYRDRPIKEVQQDGGTFEGVFYYPLRYYLGGLGTLRGYPYFSTAGGKAFFSRATLTFPIFQRIGRELPPLLFDKIYGSLFIETGATANFTSIRDILNNDLGDRSPFLDFNKDAFLTDYGFELRFQMFTHYRFPMMGYFVMAFPTRDEIPERNNPGQMQQLDDRRIYFGLAF